jgi:hypothetical protein
VPPRKASGSRRSRGARGARRGDLLGRRIGAEANPTTPELQAVYDGRVCVGFIINRGRAGFEALDAGATPLGAAIDRIVRWGAAMTAASRKPAAKLDPVEIFRARSEARALLFAAGELDLHDAVDALQADAMRDGLVDQLGQDAVQAILRDAFQAVRAGRP